MKKLDRYLSIFALVVVAGTPLLNKPVTATEAALTAPASYDYSYRYNSSTTRFEYMDSSVSIAQARFVRTADGAYYNYKHGPYTLTDGLDISMTFNRSNTSWTLESPSLGYRATDTKIGSDSTVGTIEKKIDLIFDNQTNKDYRLYLDFSSTAVNRSWVYKINNNIIVSGYSDDRFFNEYTALTSIYVPAFSDVNFYMYSNGLAGYLDAWYLKDLGVNAAYNEGFDAGEVVGYEDGYNNSVSPLWDGLEVAVGVTLNFILFIATLSIFDISLLNIGIVLVSILGLVWVLKALRG
jgi:hypothetical protein